VLWHCWLSGGVLAWLSVWERGADLHMAQLMPLPLTVSCFSEIQIGFTFLVPAHSDSPGKRAVKCVCVCYLLCMVLLVPEQKMRALRVVCRAIIVEPLSLCNVILLFLQCCCLQCIGTVGWASERASGLWKLSHEVLVWLSVWSELQIVCIWSRWCHCHPKPHLLLPHLNPDWFYLSGTGLPRLSWKRGRETGIVVVVLVKLY